MDIFVTQLVAHYDRAGLYHAFEREFVNRKGLYPNFDYRRVWRANSRRPSR